MTDKTIVLTGAAGQLGRAMTNLLRGREDYRLILSDTAQGADALRETSLPLHTLDITDVDATLALLRQVKPYAVINCAAYTAVDAQEKDAELSYRINAIGARNLAIAASETQAKLVHISTDYVFAGDATVPYTEFDATAPKSVYGKTKLAGEQFVQQFSDRFFILRTAWLYGEGKNFVRTMLSLAETKKELSVVDDQTGNPTSTEELAKAIAYLLPTDNYGLFHATCEGACSWAEFAAEIFRQKQCDVTVQPVSSEEYAANNPASAPRPNFSQLDNYMLRLTTTHRFADWHDALTRYLSQEGA